MNVIELVLFVHLIQHEALLPAEVSQPHVHPACNRAREVPLALC